MCAVLLFFFYFFYKYSKCQILFEYAREVTVVNFTKKKCAEVRRVSRDQVYIIFLFRFRLRSSVGIAPDS